MTKAGFEWDEAKNRVNVLKHGIDFGDAVRIFESSTLDRVDSRGPYGERRVNSIGEVAGIAIVNVTHTARDGTIRIISARRANRAERRLFEAFKQDPG